MGETDEPSFSLLVWGKAARNTRRAFSSLGRDLAVAAISAIIGFGIYWSLKGLPSAMEQIASVLAFTFAPLGITVLAVFLWNLFIAPAELAYESATHWRSATILGKPARLADKDAIILAGKVRWLAEQAGRSIKVWPPEKNEENMDYWHAKAIFESSHPIWTVAEINTLRRKYIAAIQGCIAASKDGNREKLAQARSVLDPVADDLAHRLTTG